MKQQGFLFRISAKKTQKPFLRLERKISMLYLAGCSRRLDSGCLWEKLTSLQVPPPCGSIVRALHQHKLGRTDWPSLQKVRHFLAEWSAQGFAWCFFTTGFFKIRCWVGSPGGYSTLALVSGLWALIPAIRKGPSWNALCLLLSKISSCILQIFHAQSQAVHFPLVGGLGPRTHLRRQRLADYLGLGF